MQAHSVASQIESWHLVEDHPDVVLATWQQIFGIAWRGRATSEGAERIRIACEEFQRQHPHGIGLLTIISATAHVPSASTRQMIASLLRAGTKFIRCSALVPEGTGFRAATVRSVVTGVTVLARQPYPHRVCSIDEAVVLFSSYLPGTSARVLDDRALRRAIEELRTIVTA